MVYKAEVKEQQLILCENRMCRHDKGKSHGQRYLQLMIAVEQVRLAALRSGGVDERRRLERARDLSQTGCKQRARSKIGIQRGEKEVKSQ